MVGRGRRRGDCALRSDGIEHRREVGMTRQITNGIRVGIFRDRPVLESCRAAYTSVIVPAHIAAYAGDGLWGFLTGVRRAGGPLDFWYDPMTYYIELGPES